MGIQRHEIRGDTPLDIKHVNDNFTTLWYDVYGNSKYAQKIKAELDAIEGRVTNAEGDISIVQQTANDVTIAFSNQKIGGRNLLADSEAERTSISEYLAVDIFSILEANPGKEITFSFDLKAAVAGTVTVYALGKYSIGSRGFSVTTDYQKFSFTYTPTIQTPADAYSDWSFYGVIGSGRIPSVKNLKIELGNVATAWSPHEGEFATTSHTFNSTGYILKDDAGETLITPTGMANEQNFMMSENVEYLYPILIDFNISSAVSSVTEFLLQVSQRPFRTFSKGAASGGGTKTSASGGGSTSGASSKSTADSNSPTAFYTNTQTQLSYPNEADHYHLVGASQMNHSHGMAHTHSTPDHSHTVDIAHTHDPVYGILETAKTDNNLYIYVDGVYRAAVTLEQQIVDLTQWITTPGWHYIVIDSPSLKKVTATAFMKSYIRR